MSVYRPLVIVTQPDGQPILARKILSLEEQLAELLAHDVINDLAHETVGDALAGEEERLHTQISTIDRQLEATMPSSLSQQLQEEREDLEGRAAALDDAFIQEAAQALRNVENELEQSGIRLSGFRRNQLEFQRDRILQEFDRLNIDPDLMA